jgi:hypothetical protein
MSHTTTELMGFFYGMRVCSKCKEEKELSDFTRDISSKDGLRYSCRDCGREYYLSRKNNTSVRSREYSKKYRLNNLHKIKQYRLNNLDKAKEYQKEYRLKERENKNRKHKEKRNSNYIYKLTCNIRSLIGSSFRNKGYTKKSKTHKILGCTFQEFKVHLENQFTEGMNWDNQGKWHLDHIHPVSLAKDEEEVIKLNHYTNFQPLWAIDNLKKSNKLITKLN